jgi:glucose/arabinose dehydrogenase
LIGRFDNDNIPGVTDWTEMLDHTGPVIVPADGGLVGFAFHPDYPSDPRVFLNYSVAPTGGENADVIISSMETTDGGATLDPATEVILIRQSRGTLHQGGFMEFDGDGMLMFSIGDGTSQGDPQGWAQNRDDYRGNVLRIDVDSGFPYAIPFDNPYAFSGGSPLPEIYAYGFRNPFRGDIDQVTQQL